MTMNKIITASAASKKKFSKGNLSVEEKPVFNRQMTRHDASSQL
jgi:hypothetical protein